MALAKTHGIVLRRTHLGEADRLLTILTKRFGKVKAVSKGSRRPKSRHGGHVEPFNVAEFMLWRREGRELALVRTADLVERAPDLERDLEAFTAAQFAAELIDSSLVTNDPHPELYALLRTFTRALKHPGKAFPALLAFMVRAAAVLGYLISVERCADCRARLAGGREEWLEYSLGGILCGKCARHGMKSGETLRAGVARALRAASARPPRSAVPGEAAEASRAVDRFLSYHQDRQALNSARFLKPEMALAR